MASSSWSVSPTATPKLARKSRIEGDGWGLSTYALYEAPKAQQGQAQPYLFVWLHGVDHCGELGVPDMAAIQKHLGHRTYFLVPQSPKPGGGGLKFFWGVSATRAQNKDNLGYIFGEICEGYLTSLTNVIRDVAAEIQACRTILAGYSMGGFGAYHIAGYAPHLFDAVISVAGYCMGTTETSDRGVRVPQPQSANVFKGFLARFAPKLAEVPLVIALHAPVDKVSSYKDTEMIIATVKSFGGNARVISVPENLSDSDLSARVKNRDGHHYLKACLLSDTSDMLFYNMFKAELARRGRPGAKAVVARPSSSSINPPGAKAAVQRPFPSSSGPAAKVAAGVKRAFPAPQSSQANLHASMSTPTSSLLKQTVVAKAGNAGMSSLLKQSAIAKAGNAGMSSLLKQTAIAKAGNAGMSTLMSSLLKHTAVAKAGSAAGSATDASSRSGLPSQQRTGQYSVHTSPGKRLCLSLAESVRGKSLQAAASIASSNAGAAASSGKSVFGNAKAAARISPGAGPIRPLNAAQVSQKHHAGPIRPLKWNH